MTVECKTVKLSRMEADFYNIDQRWLASYFEKDWFDKVLELNLNPNAPFEYPRFAPTALYSDYHEKFTEFLAGALRANHYNPTSLLEVGSSLGRTFFEVCQKIKSVEDATLVEPSKNFAQAFSQIFNNESTRVIFPILLGNKSLGKMEFDTKSIQQACRAVKRNLFNLPYEEISDEIHTHDLVICSNVIDQCKKPRSLIEFLKARTKENGILALSCTYQWNAKYVDDSEEPITNINLLFNDEWKLIDETNIEFKFRRNERWWQTFLSHVSVLQKVS